MDNPYKAKLEELEGKENVIVHRASAQALEGKLERVEDEGCVISWKGVRHDAIVSTFVAYKDIRGVGHEDWDHDVIS